VFSERPVPWLTESVAALLRVTGEQRGGRGCVCALDESTHYDPAPFITSPVHGPVANGRAGVSGLPCAGNRMGVGRSSALPR
jgi:hypothetical protein